MTSEAGVLTAILVMAIATYAMRAGGFWIMSHVPLTPRLRRMLEALPGSVVVAVVLPIIARDGAPAALAIGAAGAAMFVTRSDLLAVVVGMAVAAAVRAAGL
jgi:branched chain amino acid efflux pump